MTLKTLQNVIVMKSFEDWLMRRRKGRKKSEDLPAFGSIRELGAKFPKAEDKCYHYYLSLRLL